MLGATILEGTTSAVVVSTPYQMVPCAQRNSLVLARTCVVTDTCRSLHAQQLVAASNTTLYVNNWNET